MSCLAVLVGRLRRDRTGTLVFTAIDDYTKWLWLVLPIARIFAPRWKILLVRYRIDDVIDDHKLFGARAKGWLVALVRYLTSATVCCFDERVNKKHYHLLPDPWSGPFGQFEARVARREYGWNEHDFVIGLIGTQDARKGFDVAVKAMLLLADKSVNVCIVGRIEGSQEGCADRLREAYGERLTHFDYYVSDDVLAKVMAASSVILLPYHSAFSATSGVLSRAAASGTRVIASEHGLVGWRVRRWELGAVFRYPDAEELADKIRAIRRETSYSNAKEFASRSTDQALVSSFGSIWIALRDG
ncbi:MAG: glycosyltransferase family 1 protein [Rhodococcus sp. (in: high G+C Gram-positive bacteria)]|nr:MAG: glycosyltransferase family 1 protein [Rhodococcus sp. (in: high G+C Gram-positive bacteria)]